MSHGIFIRVLFSLSCGLVLCGCSLKISLPFLEPARTEVAREVDPPLAPDPVLVAQIDSAIKDPAAQTARLKGIAGRNPLPVADQLYLVDRVMYDVDHAYSRLSVLKVLVANPEFSDKAEERILERIDQLEERGCKRDLKEAMDKAKRG